MIPSTVSVEAVGRMIVAPAHNQSSFDTARTIDCGKALIDLNDTDEVVGITFLDLTVFEEA